MQISCPVFFYKRRKRISIDHAPKFMNEFMTLRMFNNLNVQRNSGNWYNFFQNGSFYDPCLSMYASCKNLWDQPWSVSMTFWLDRLLKSKPLSNFVSSLCMEIWLSLHDRNLVQVKLLFDDSENSSNYH